jgi:hypothetical protein
MFRDSADSVEPGYTLCPTLNRSLAVGSRVYHDVTAVMPLDPRLSAYRDVLVVTFRRE